MQDYPGAPGTARPEYPGTAVPAACGGAAVLLLPPAPDPHRSSATSLPLAPAHNRSGATPLPQVLDLSRSSAAPLPQASGHVRPGAASMALPGHADAGCGPVSAGPSVPLTTAPVPAHPSRLLQEVLPRVTATPLTLTSPQSRSVTYPGYPALLAPTRPPPATAGTGFLRQRHSRAPPTAASRKTYPCELWSPRCAGGQLDAADRR